MLIGETPSSFYRPWTCDFTYWHKKHFKNLCQTIYSVLIICHNWSKWHPYWRNCLGYERFPCYRRHKFSPIAHGYNRQERPFQARVNNWPVMSPQRKGRLPQYSRGQLKLRQMQFNELESMGVFQKPEDVGVTVKYLNLSFLVEKASVDSALLLSFPKKHVPASRNHPWCLMLIPHSW